VGPLLDRINVVAEADRRVLRPIGPGGYTGGEYYRAPVEICLAGGDFPGRPVAAGRPGHHRAARRERVADCAHAVAVPGRRGPGPGGQGGRGQPGDAAAGLGRRRRPDRRPVDHRPGCHPGRGHGPGKEGSAFSRTGQTALSPLIGVVGETGDVLGLRARGGAANDGRAMGSFIDECVAAIPAGVRERYRLWIRVDSAGYQEQVIEAAARHQADFSVTARGYANVRDAVYRLAADPDTAWAAALGRETAAGSQIAETTATLLGRQLRLIVRRQPRSAGEQLAIDDLDGWRLHAIITNIDPARMSAAEVEAHHRLRGGIPRTPSGH